MSKNAYVTFLPDDSDIENIISLYYTYKKTNSLYPFIVLYCDNITNKAIKRLQDYGVTLARIPAEKQYKNDEKLGIRKNNLYPFTMVDYDKIMYVNWQNQVFLKNADILFDYQEFPLIWTWVNPDNSNEIRLNNIWYSCVPNKEIYQQMAKGMENDYIEGRVAYEVLKAHPEYKKTILHFPIFTEYWYQGLNLTGKSNEEIERSVDNISKKDILEYRFLYFFYGWTELLKNGLN